MIPQVAAGRCDFGIADAATILAARAQQVPIVAVFAALQTNPRCILVHAGGPQRLAELRGHTEMSAIVYSLPARNSWSARRRSSTSSWRFTSMAKRSIAYSILTGAYA